MVDRWGFDTSGELGAVQRGVLPPCGIREITRVVSFYNSKILQNIGYPVQRADMFSGEICLPESVYMLVNV